MPDWKKIKAEYLRGGISYQDLSDKYNVPFSTVCKHAMREKWTDLRKESGTKMDKELASSVAHREARRKDLLATATDTLLDRISENINNGLFCQTEKGCKDIASALRDIRDLKGIKNELDVQEQIARIEKLHKETQTPVTNDGETYGIIVMPSITEGEQNGNKEDT